MLPQQTKHIIAASNILFGTGYFLILPLPNDWRITRSYLEPDIHSTARRGDIVWVEAGQTDQIIFHPLRRVAMDMMIRIKRGRHDGPQVKGVQVSSRGTGTVGGHPASFCVGEVKQGLFKKKIVKTLRFSFYCPELQHTLFLHFTGHCQEIDLKEIHDSVISLECH